MNTSCLKKVRRNCFGIFGTIKKNGNDLWKIFKSFCICFYMIEYDVYHRTTKFKMICKLSKLAKHSKYNEIWGKLRKMKMSRNLIISISTPWNDSLQSSKFTCTFVWCPGLEFDANNLKIKLNSSASNRKPGRSETLLIKNEAVCYASSRKPRWSEALLIKNGVVCSASNRKTGRSGALLIKNETVCSTSNRKPGRSEARSKMERSAALPIENQCAPLIIHVFSAES